MIQVVLYEPEIPWNTGAIARTTAMTKTKLHLIEPLGFSIEEKAVKRAGLDYWPLVDLTVHESWEAFLTTVEDRSRLFFATSKTTGNYASVTYREGDYLVFGPETRGLPASLMDEYPETQRVRIPMRQDVPRSLNLANSCNIILYEALRQLRFPGLG